MSCGVPVVVNPTAGGGRLLRWRKAMEEAARGADTSLEWWYTEGPEHAAELGRRAAAEHRQLLFAFGGDGTYNEVARGLLGTATALGVLPGGTTSVLAYEFGIPRSPAAALAALLSGSERPMRVGRTDRGDLFLLMVSAGPDSLVLDRLSPLFKRLGGRVGVALQAVVEFGRARLPRILAHYHQRSVEVGWAIVGKSRCYAGPFHATPGADPFVDQLEMVGLQSASRRAVIPFTFGIATGTHLRRRDVISVPLSRMRLEPALEAHPVPYQIDGDCCGMLPIEIWVDPEPLQVRLPPPLAAEMLVAEGSY
jgi:diacylglycerol kinase family enzyme